MQLFVTSRSNGSNFLYTIYLGENDTNDFNVRRNHNYNITLNLKSEIRDDRVLAAAANCFVVNTNNEIMFDPYTRTETGGGWKYSDYVNKKVPAKKIAYVKILWQYVNVIGDNRNGDRVWLDQYDRVLVETDPPTKSCGHGTSGSTTTSRPTSTRLYPTTLSDGPEVPTVKQAASSPPTTSAPLKAAH